MRAGAGGITRRELLYVPRPHQLSVTVKRDQEACQMSDDRFGRIDDQGRMHYTLDSSPSVLSDGCHIGISEEELRELSKASRQAIARTRREIEAAIGEQVDLQEAKEYASWRWWLGPDEGMRRYPAGRPIRRAKEEQEREERSRP
jgi:hypothetical protein